MEFPMNSVLLHGAAILIAQNFTIENPDFDANDSIGGVSFGKCVVNVGA